MRTPASTEGYAEFVATKRGMAEALRTLTSRTREKSRTRQRISDALATLLDAGLADGTLREDIRPDDVAASLVGVFLATATSDDPAQVGRMLDLLVHGLTPR